MTTLGDWILYWANQKPSKAAIIHDGTPVSYGLLGKLVEATRRYLEGSGIESWSAGGERKVAIISFDSILDSWIALIAARNMGFDTLCVRNIDGALVSKVRNVGCVIVARHEGKHLKVRENFEHRDKVVAVPQFAYEPRALASMKLRPPVSGPGGHILSSSGTTGVPKCIMVGPQNEAAVATAYGRHARLTKSSKAYLLDYTLTAAGGYLYGLSSFQIGATIIIHQVNGFLSTFYKEEFDYVNIRPSHIDQLFDPAHRMLCRPKPRLRLHMGGGFVNFAKIKWIYENITSEIYHIYGATENSAFAKTKIVTEDDLLWHEIYPHRVVEIVDESDRVVPDGVEGSLRVKCEDYTAHGYIDDQEATDACFRYGYFYTGDLAVRRADRRIRILGRVSDVLFIKSEKYPVGPIEAKVQALVGCLNACVFSLQNDNTQAEVLIGLEMDAAPSTQQRDALCRMFRMVDNVHVFNLSAFPTTEGGKVDRSALRQLLCAARDGLSAGVSQA